MTLLSHLERAGAGHEASAIDPDQDGGEAGAEEDVLRHPEVQVEAILGERSE